LTAGEKGDRNKIPNHKFQIPNKHQAPITQMKRILKGKSKKEKGKSKKITRD
jgi:hypothetical protein